MTSKPPFGGSSSSAPIQIEPWQINLTRFNPQSKNYSNDDDNGCVICQDYADIDVFARALSLDNLNILKCPPPNTVPTTNKKIFDATLLFRVLTDLGNDRAGPGTEKAVPVKAGTTLKELWQTFDFDDKEDAVVTKDLFAILQEKIKALDDLKAEQEDFKGWLEKQRQNEGAAENDLDFAGAKLQADERIAQLTQEQKDLRDLSLQNKTLYAKRGDRIFQELAKLLWNQFLQCQDLEEDQIAKSRQDNVAKARLIYSWLAYSIEYDFSLVGLLGAEKGRAVRRMGNMLINGKEVCRWYAQAFVIMFTAIKTIEGTLTVADAVYVSGHARSWNGGGPNTDKWDEMKHGWVRFPLVPYAGTNVYKLVDPTWAAPDKEGKFNPLAWSQSNGAFRWDHIPNNDSDFVLPTGAPYISQQEMRDTVRPVFPIQTKYRNTALLWIDKDTLNQNKLSLVQNLPNGGLEITFKNNCRHQAQLSPAFWLAVIELKPFQVPWGTMSNDILSAVTYKRETVKNIVKFTVQARLNATTVPVWSARIDKLSPHSVVAILVDETDRGSTQTQQPNWGVLQPVVVWTYDTPKI